MRPIFTSFLLCISVFSAIAERFNFDDTETLQYIQEKRLRNVAELERLERLELLAKERQLQSDGYSYYQDRRRLQEQLENTEIGQEDLFNDFNGREGEEGEGEVEGFAARRSPNNNRRQEYSPPNAYGRQAVNPRNNQNPYNSNPKNRNSGYPNNNDRSRNNIKTSNKDRSGSNNLNRYPASSSSNRNVGSGRYSNNDGWRTSNSQMMCCQDCRRGDVNCLSSCDRICINSQQCSKTGEGAYAAFCQTACPHSAGGFGLNYLPIKACEGECAAQVQELCDAHSCRDYGCRARNCRAQAPLKCQMT